MPAGSNLAALELQLAREPGSLVFLTLGETHRKEGRLAQALAVAERGVSWYPEMAGAWDLLARIRSDRGEGDLAFEAWTTVLRLDPEHLGAHKGMAFLAFRAGELERSLRYLRRALDLAPHDAGLRRVFDRVGREIEARVFRAPVRRSPFEEPEWAGHALLLDLQGGILAGVLPGPDGPIGGGPIAAALSGLSRDAERTTRLLGLGPWQRISLGGERPLEIRSPTIDTLLVVSQADSEARATLPGQADRLAVSVRHWLEALR